MTSKRSMRDDQRGQRFGVPAGVGVNKQPKNFRDAMSREDQQEWASAYDLEYQGFLQHGTLKLALPYLGGAKVIGTTTSTEYKARSGCVSWVIRDPLPTGRTVRSCHESGRGVVIRGDCCQASPQSV
jgi:hypothetical protein